MKNNILKIITITALAVTSIASTPNQTYKVMRGDTLSGIATTKLGEMNKWQELWKINNDHIKNPNLIYPGQTVRLLTGAQIDFFDSRQGALEASNTKKPMKRRSRSQEWRLLPDQSWEKFIVKKNEFVDQLGFDKHSKVKRRFNNKTEVYQTIASDRIAILGEITHSRTEHEQIFLGEQVFIRADEPLQVGSIYSVTPGPEKVKSKRDGRVGFIYEIYGKIKIIGVRDEAFIGTVIDVRYPISRKNLLIPEVVSSEIKKPIPSPSVLVASVMMNEKNNGDMLGEHHLLFLDLGASEGIQPGMIFRYYLHDDPYTGKEITGRDYLIESELMVLEVFEQFSLAIILNSRGSLKANAEVVSLTDLTDFAHNMGMQTAIQDNKPISMPDELDQLDSSQGLGEKEEHELRQLESWTKISEEIKREPRGDEKNLPAIGNEPAPNDHSDQTAPQAAPETSTEAPATEPESATPPPPEEALPPETTTPSDAPTSSTLPGTLPADPQLDLPPDPPPAP